MLSSYPFGACVSTYSYLPAFKVNSCSLSVDTNSNDFPLSKPSVQVTFILAPGTSFPVATSTFLINNLPVVALSLTSHLTTWPSFVISNFPISLLSSYPFGACISTYSYFPAFNVNSCSLSVDTNSNDFPLSKPSVQVTFIFAPGTSFPVAMSTFLINNLPVVALSVKSNLVTSSALTSTFTGFTMLYPLGALTSLIT